MVVFQLLRRISNRIFSHGFNRLYSISIILLGSILPKVLEKNVNILSSEFDVSWLNSLLNSFVEKSAHIKYCSIFFIFSILFIDSSSIGLEESTQ